MTRRGGGPADGAQEAKAPQPPVPHYEPHPRWPDQMFGADREAVLEAVQRDGGALLFALDSLREDRQFVLEAVKQNGCALQFAAESLRRDRAFVLEALHHCGRVFLHASATLRGDREFVLQVV